MSLTPDTASTLRRALATAIEAARHARDHGARVIVIHQPVHPYVSAEGWIAWGMR